MKIEHQAHGSKTSDPVINTEKDEQLFLVSGVTLEHQGVKNETEISLFKKAENKLVVLKAQVDKASAEKSTINRAIADEISSLKTEIKKVIHEKVAFEENATLRAELEKAFDDKRKAEQIAETAINHYLTVKEENKKLEIETTKLAVGQSKKEIAAERKAQRTVHEKTFDVVEVSKVKAEDKSEAVKYEANVVDSKENMNLVDDEIKELLSTLPEIQEDCMEKSINDIDHKIEERLLKLKKFSKKLSDEKNKVRVAVDKEEVCEEEVTLKQALDPNVEATAIRKNIVTKIKKEPKSYVKDTIKFEVKKDDFLDMNLEPMHTTTEQDRQNFNIWYYAQVDLARQNRSPRTPVTSVSSTFEMDLKETEEKCLKRKMSRSRESQYIDHNHTIGNMDTLTVVVVVFAILKLLKEKCFDPSKIQSSSSPKSLISSQHIPITPSLKISNASSPSCTCRQGSFLQGFKERFGNWPSGVIQ